MGFRDTGYDVGRTAFDLAPRRWRRRLFVGLALLTLAAPGVAGPVWVFFVKQEARIVEGRMQPFVSRLSATTTSTSVVAP